MREKILGILEKNGRIDLADVAAMLGVSEAEVANEVAQMEKENVICGYHTLINWDKTGDERVTALIEVKVTPQRGGFDQVAQRMYRFEEVDAVYLISGSCDFTLIIRGKTMKEVAQFVSGKLSVLDAVRGTATNFVLKKYKDHGTILDDNKNTDERMLVTP